MLSVEVALVKTSLPWTTITKMEGCEDCSVQDATQVLHDLWIALGTLDEPTVTSETTEQQQKLF